MFTDMVFNGEARGEVAEQLGQMNYDPGLLRPFVDNDGKQYCVINTGRTEYNEELQEFIPIKEKVRTSDLAANGLQNAVWNATSLRKDDWIMIDRAVVEAARKRLIAWNDLAAANTFGGFNGMAKMILEHETMSDPGSTQVDMDALSSSPSDAPKFQLEGLPLPITHSDFHFSERRIAVSRNSSTPLDLTQASMAGRRVAETIEKTLIGVETGVTYGKTADYGRTPTVYGYLNFPDRITKTDMTTPTGSNGGTILDDWLAMRELLYNANMFGPFQVYTSSDWDQYLDNSFSTSEPSAGTLRSRLLEVDGFKSIKRLDYLTGTSNPFTVIMIQMDPDTARAVNGMDLTTVMWDSTGGLRKNFKVMAINVAQLRADYNGNCGIAVGTIS